ncbi:MAG: 50S ribosomal protein L1 [Gammaproteobacteria bacterium]|nr:50S ribosomal protein L1 [Gammaproteobacteria bacterium]
MVKLSKRWRQISEKVDPRKFYLPEEAFKLLKECGTAKFKESVDISIQLGIDPKKSEQGVRGTSLLPHGIGKTTKIAVFARGDDVDLAKKSGADTIGCEDLIDLIKKGQLDCDVIIATPETMSVVSQVGQILGPKGLMPNPKSGTVTKDVYTAVKNFKMGQARFRTDRSGIIHCRIGSVELAEAALTENLFALFSDIKKLKPATMKGVFIKKVVVSTTMGPGLPLERSLFVV